MKSALLLALFTFPLILGCKMSDIDISLVAKVGGSGTSGAAVVDTGEVVLNSDTLKMYVMGNFSDGSDKSIWMGTKDDLGSVQLTSAQHGMELLSNADIGSGFSFPNGLALFAKDSTNYHLLFADNDFNLTTLATFSDNGVGPVLIERLDGTIFFIIKNAAAEMELWKSDTTISGTQFIKKVGDSYTYQSYRFQAHKFNGKIYFSGNTIVGGAELWVSDGTSAGTYEVQDLLGGGSSSPGHYNVYGDYLYFLTVDQKFYQMDKNQNVRLVLSNITKYTHYHPAMINGSLCLTFGLSVAPSAQISCINEQTLAVENFSSFTGTETSKVGVLGDSKGKLYFFHYNSVSEEVDFYRSSGTNASSIKIGSAGSDINIMNVTVGSDTEIAIFASLFFTDNATASNNSRIVRLDENGFTDFTNLVAGFGNIGLATSRDSAVLVPKESGTVVFLTQDSSNILRLFVSDGTLAGTQEVHQFDYADLATMEIGLREYARYAVRIFDFVNIKIDYPVNETIFFISFFAVI